MTKFLFKSDNKSDLYKNISNKLELVLAEQRHQRIDLAALLRMEQSIYNALALQKQVDEYFDEDDENKSEHIPDSK